MAMARAPWVMGQRATKLAQDFYRFCSETPHPGKPLRPGQPQAPQIIAGSSSLSCRPFVVDVPFPPCHMLSTLSRDGVMPSLGQEGSLCRPHRQHHRESRW